MRGNVNQKSGKRWFSHLPTIACALLIGLSGVIGVAVAQEEIPPEEMVAFYQWSVPYRFGSDLKVGDWVRYRETTEGEKTVVGLEVTAKEGGNLVIVESRHKETEEVGGESHLIVDLQAMKLVGGFHIDESGNKQTTTLLDDQQVAAIVQEKLEMVQQMGAQGKSFAWKKHAEEQVVELPAGSFVCWCIEPEMPAQTMGAMPPQQLEAMKSMFRLCFCEDVPKLVPISACLAAITGLEVIGEMEGGFVKSWYLELMAHSGQE
jgi:hypothetical protein